MKSAAILLALWCGPDVHQTLQLPNSWLMMTAQAQRDLVWYLAVYGSYKPYEYIYTADDKKKYRVVVQLSDIIFSITGYKPEPVIPACTKVG